MRRSLALATLLAGLATGANADVLLLGAQHIGDDESASFTPADPVTRLQMLGAPTRFHLSQGLTITAVRFNGAFSLDGLIDSIYFDNVRRTGVLSGSTFTLGSPLALASGVHSIAPDPGCFDALDLPAVCGIGTTENDIGFSALTLVSVQTSNSRMLTRRRHIGDDNEAQNDNYGGDYYPDLLEAPPADLRADMSFTLDANRVLTAIQFYRLRGVNTPAGNHAQVLIDNVPITELPGDGNPRTQSVVRALALGTHTLSVVAGSITAGNRDSISWDDVILNFSDPIGGIPGRFNAVANGANAVSGAITTQVAGQAFTLDIVALNLDGTATQTDYTGTVTVELLDASVDSAPDAYGCHPSWNAVQALGTVTFGAGDNGRRSVSITYTGALRVARLRVVDNATAIAGCSTDAFAVRPNDLAVQVSHGTSSTAGIAELLNDTGTGGNRTHRAGRPFTVRATARAVGGATVSSYVGSPTLTLQSTVQGSQPGLFVEGSWTGSGTRRTDTASYSESGTFNLTVSDSTFAEVDALDTPLAQRTLSGTVGVGRFTPDHFRLVSRNTPQFLPACNSFTYVGQGFGYQVAPEAVLEAVNANGVRTINYEGQLYKLPAAATGSVYRAADANTGTVVPLDTSLIANPGNTLAALGAGLVRLRYNSGAQLATLRTQPIAAFDIEVELEAPTITDSDGVAYADPTVLPLKFGAATAGNGIAFSGTGSPKQQRYGRLFLRNGYGPETQPLDLAWGAEYFTGATTGWSRNLADACTTANLGDATLTGGIAASTSLVSVSSPLLAGQGTIRLAAPNVIGSTTLSLTGPAWLGTDSNGDNVYAEPATSTATFGQFREADQRIYLRETFR